MFPVATAVDDDPNFVLAACKLIKSLKAQGDVFSAYYCLYESLSKENEGVLVEAGWAPAQVSIPDYPLGFVKSRCIWYRHLLPGLVDSEFVLYLDSDMLAVASLEPVRHLPNFMRRYGKHVGWVNWPAPLLYPYNTAFGLYDVPAWREHKYAESIFKLGAEWQANPGAEVVVPVFGGDEIKLVAGCTSWGPDEVAANLVMAGKVFPVWPEWNYVPGFYNTRIVHFAGPKPWMDGQNRHGASPSIISGNEFPRYRKLWRET